MIQHFQSIRIVLREKPLEPSRASIVLINKPWLPKQPCLPLARARFKLMTLVYCGSRLRAFRLPVFGLGMRCAVWFWMRLDRWQPMKVARMRRNVDAGASSASAYDRAVPKKLVSRSLIGVAKRWLTFNAASTVAKIGSVVSR